MNGAKLAALYKPPTLFDRAKAVIKKYNGNLFVASDAYCYSDSGGTTPATQDGVVGYWKDLIGSNHATQGTTANKPILRKGAKNWLLNTATLSTQNVTTIARSYTLSFTGTGSVTLTGTSTAGPLAGTGANDRVSLTFTPTAGTLTLTVAGSVTNAMLEFGSVFTGYGASGATSASNGSGDWWVDFGGNPHHLILTSFLTTQTNDPNFNVSSVCPSTSGTYFVRRDPGGGSARTGQCRFGGANFESVDYGNANSTPSGTHAGFGISAVYSAIRSSATLITLYSNGVSIATDTVNPGTTTDSFYPYIGSWAAYWAWYTGGVYSISLGTGVISDGERNILERYMAKISGVTL